MKLLVVRHAIAEDRDEWSKTGEPDDTRPLTEKGRKRMRRIARALQELEPRLDLLGTSPYARAVQTAEIVAQRYGEVAVVVAEDLIPERSFEGLLEWVTRLDEAEVVALVGHEPHLSGFISWLLTARDQSLLELKKGGAVLLELARPPAVGAARLLWALTPRQLRRLA